MPIPYDLLKTSLVGVLRGSGDHRQVADLVFLSRTIVQAHLQHMRASMLWLHQHQGVTLIDLGYDCVGDIFKRGADGRYLLLGAFASSLAAPIEETPPLDIFLAYRTLLARVADQHIARLFAQVDPAGGRIFRNIRECAKKSSLFEIDHDIRGLVLRPRNGDRHDELGAFPVEELARSLFHGAGKDRSTGGLLRALHEVLTHQKEYRRSLPVTDVTYVFKLLFASDLESELEGPRLPFDGLGESDLEEIRGEVEIVLRQKVLVTYVMKGKIDAGQARLMFDAFHDLLGDWIKSGEATDGLFEYLRRHVDLSAEAYRDEYRPKMEYLLRIAREELQARLMREI